MQLFLFASEQPNLGPVHLYPVTFSFAEVVVLFSLGLFASLFNCLRQRIAKSLPKCRPNDFPFQNWPISVSHYNKFRLIANFYRFHCLYFSHQYIACFI